MKKLVRWFDGWNDDKKPMTLIWLLLFWIGFVGWIILTLAFVWDASLNWELGINLYPFLMAHAWFGLLGGIIGLTAIVETNRWIYSHRFLLPLLPDDEGNLIRLKRQDRIATRIEPVLTGIVERILLTTLGMLILTATDPRPVATLGAIGAGYVVIKSIKRFLPSETNVNASIHSIWGSSISVAIALVGAWWFSEMP